MATFSFKHVLNSENCWPQLSALPVLYTARNWLRGAVRRTAPAWCVGMWTGRDREKLSNQAVEAVMPTSQPRMPQLRHVHMHQMTAFRHSEHEMASCGRFAMVPVQPRQSADHAAGTQLARTQPACT